MEVRTLLPFFRPQPCSIMSMDLDPYEADFERSATSTPASGFLTPASQSASRTNLIRLADTVQSRGSTASLSRSPSSSFAPGAHRRSHPNLSHISLAPLTPKYPINPSDYDAYIDPSTSQLHTSTSLTQISSLPSPGGILTNSPARSRATSRTRNLKRKIKSSVAFAGTEQGVVEPGRLTPAPSGAVTSQGLGGRITAESPSRGSSLRLSVHTQEDPGWLVQTGLALTEASREDKGQSWLTKRASSTSLHTPVTEYGPGDPLPERARSPYVSARNTPYVSGRTTPNRSRRGSRDRRRSRRELAMTPAQGLSPVTTRQSQAATDGPSTSRLISTSSHDQAFAVPDWADEQTQAEIAVELEASIAAGLEDDGPDSDDPDREWWREDRYGGVDFEGHWDHAEEEDEADVRKAMKASGFGVGRWVDGVVDAMLRIEDLDEAGQDLGLEQSLEDAREQDARQREEEGTKETAEGAHPSDSRLHSDDSMETAPENPTSVWEDVAWFGRLVLHTARS